MPAMIPPHQHRITGLYTDPVRHVLGTFKGGGSQNRCTFAGSNMELRQQMVKSVWAECQPRRATLEYQARQRRLPLLHPPDLSRARTSSPVGGEPDTHLPGPPTFSLSVLPAPICCSPGVEAAQSTANYPCRSGRRWGEIPEQKWQLSVLAL